MLFKAIIVAAAIVAVSSAAVTEQPKQTTKHQVFQYTITNKGWETWIPGGAYWTPSGWPASTAAPYVPTTSAPPSGEKPECKACACGWANQKDRIVGGQETKVNQYPWMALLLNNGRAHCGGSVINSRYILTACHCVDGYEDRLSGIRLMEHNIRSTSEAKAIDYKIKRIIKHSGYSRVNFNNDIALIMVDREIKFDNNMRPVCLPERGHSFAGMEGLVTGWGATSEGGIPSQSLREVKVPILSNDACRKSRYPARRITDNMLCAGYSTGKKDSCQGDSGGPLHIINETLHYVAGVVSWGEGCAQPNYPGVYTRVNRYRSWIEKNTQDACYCEIVRRKSLF